MENDIFAIHVPVEFFDRAIEDKVDLRVNYFDPSLEKEVIVELDQDYANDYYQKLFINPLSEGKKLDESYHIPVGLERTKEGLRVLSVDEFFEKQAAEGTESYFIEIDISGENEEVLIVSFSKEIMIKALMNEEKLVMQVNDSVEIVIDKYIMQNVLSEQTNKDYVNLIYRKIQKEQYEFFGILIESNLDSKQLKTEIKDI
jgi:hypothetical protein